MTLIRPSEAAASQRVVPRKPRPPREEKYARVAILTDRFEPEGVPRGAIGYVIERYGDDALEVEISDPASGETVATVVAVEAELGHAPVEG